MAFNSFEHLCEECPYDNPFDRERRKKILSNGLDDDWQPEYLYCNKIGGEHWQYGYCPDCNYSPYKTSSQKTRAVNVRGRAYRRAWKINEQFHARKDIERNGWASKYRFPICTNREGERVDNHQYACKIVNNTKKYFKRGAAHCARKEMYLVNGSDYKRIKSSWWWR